MLFATCLSFSFWNPSISKGSMSVWNVQNKGVTRKILFRPTVYFSSQKFLLPPWKSFSPWNRSLNKEVLCIWNFQNGAVRVLRHKSKSTKIQAYWAIIANYLSTKSNWNQSVTFWDNEYTERQTDTPTPTYTHDRIQNLSPAGRQRKLCRASKGLLINLKVYIYTLIILCSLPRKSN